MKRLFSVLLLACLFCVATGAWALEFTLSEEERSTLNEEALEKYEEGTQHLDHINYPFALESFQEAMENAPGHLGIRFLVGKIARFEADKSFGEEAKENLRIARGAYAEIMAMDNLKRAERERAERQLERVDEMLQTQLDRDAERERIAQKLIKEEQERLQEIHARKATAARAEQLRRRQEAETSGGNRSRGGGVSGMGGMPGM